MAKELRYDVDGFEAITEALRTLLNTFPVLEEGETVTFSTLDADSGLSMFPTVGSTIQNEVEDVVGHVVQTCLYPFTIVYRIGGTTQNRKAKVKEWLDDFGKWLERQEIKNGAETYRLDEYPALTGNRKILNIQRTTMSALGNTYNDGVEDWVITLSATYRNEFDR